MNFKKTQIIVIFLLGFYVDNVAAQGTPKDQYRQMGSVAAIAETCYGSKIIPQKLNISIKKSVSSHPESEDVLNQLVGEYNEAYKYAIVNLVVWNGATQSYNKKPFNCSDKKDIDFIKQLESKIHDSL